MTPGRRSWARLHRRARPLSPREAAGAGGWLVLAPHPDDETLGCGGLIAALAARGTSPTVAFLTDGSGSHVGAPGWSPSRIAAVRAQEAATALRCLGVTAPSIALGWRDAAPFAPGTPAFDRTLRRLVALCRARRIRTIVASWEGDPHCDHEAAARLATAVAGRLRIACRFYCVWGWTRPDLDRRLAGMRVSAMPVARWRGDQRRALDRHRTQLGGRIAGAPDRFVLPRAMRRLVDASHLLLLEPRHAA
ncbi:PIG-L deacetylase family protein [Sphingomonas sp. 1P08PE]|uniref:PIG-L deacetylase family protein n=1 Tax=Sphingomonas sp. 1P08PE TaxID=554122 RepID=UPI00399F0C68